MGSATRHAVRRKGGWTTAGAVLLLAVIIWMLHGRALDFGLFLDDYAHYQQLREADWSLAGLTAACRLELVGGISELWWIKPFTLRFFRPVSFGLMKLTYTLSGWDPKPMHAASLLWHTASSILLMVLLRRLGARRLMAFCMAALFAAHPAHIATVQWIACQSELMVTTFLLAATLCYIRFRDIRDPAERKERSAVEAERRPNRSLTVAARFGGSSGASLAWAGGVVVLFFMALGCRENAIAFPFVLLALEPFAARERRRAGLALYGVLGLIAAAYFVTRWQLLGGVALPPRPYIIPPGDPDFVRYIIDKTCYYLLGEFLAVPCIPIGGLPYLRAHPLVFYGLTLAVVLLVLGLAGRFMRRYPGLIGPVWLLGFMAPVLPAFESPHHLYLPGVGWAICAMLIFRGMRGEAPARLTLRSRATATWGAIALVGVGFMLVTHFLGVPLDAAAGVEDRVFDEVAAAPSGLKDGDTLYLVNQPLIAHYLKLAVERRTGVRDLRVVPLTWSPRLLGLDGDGPAELTWIDDRSFQTRIAGSDRYFAGPIGRLVREAAQRARVIEAGAPVDFGDFRVELVERDELGVAALRFTFAQSLDRDGIHLFWGSTTRWAQEIRPPRWTRTP